MLSGPYEPVTFNVVVTAAGCQDQPETFLRALDMDNVGSAVWLSWFLFLSVLQMDCRLPAA